jgi:hypothetical protein
MVQRVLGGQAMLRDDSWSLCRRLSRIEHRLSAMEHAILVLQSSDADRVGAETDVQDRIDALTARIERLEGRTS